MTKTEIVKRLSIEEPDRTGRAYWQLLARILRLREQVGKKEFNEKEYQEIKQAIQERKAILPPKQFRMITAFGETKSPADWTLDSRCKAPRTVLYIRVFQLGWDTERAITTKVSNYTKEDREMLFQVRANFAKERTSRKVSTGREWVERFRQANGILTEMEPIAA